LKRGYYRIEAKTMSNHKIGICGEMYDLNCIPPGMTVSNFNFQEQLTAAGFTVNQVEIF